MALKKKVVPCHYEIKIIELIQTNKVN